MSNVIGFKAYKNTLKRDSGYAPVSGENGYSVIRCVFPVGDDWDDISAVSAGFFVHPKDIAVVTEDIVEGEERAALFTIPGALLKQGERLHFGLFATVDGVTIATNTVVLDVARGIVSDDIDYDPAEAAGMFEQFSNALNTALLGKADKVTGGNVAGTVLTANSNGNIRSSGYTVDNVSLGAGIPTSPVVQQALNGKADKADAGSDGELAALDGNGALIRSGVSVAESVDPGSNNMVPTTEAVRLHVFSMLDDALNGSDNGAPSLFVRQNTQTGKYQLVYEDSYDVLHVLFDFGLLNVPTKTSQLTNDSGFLTQHQDISGKADKAAAGTDGELAAFDGVGALERSGILVAPSIGAGSNTKVPTTAAVKLVLDGKADKATTGDFGELAALDDNGALIRSGVSVTQGVGAGSNSTVPTTAAVKTALDGKANKLSGGGGGELVSATGGGEIQRSGFFVTQSIGSGAANMLPSTAAVRQYATDNKPQIGFTGQTVTLNGVLNFYFGDFNGEVLPNGVDISLRENVFKSSLSPTNYILYNFNAIKSNLLYTGVFKIRKVDVTNLPQEFTDAGSTIYVYHYVTTKTYSDLIRMVTYDTADGVKMWIQLVTLGGKDASDNVQIANQTDWVELTGTPKKDISGAVVTLNQSVYTYDGTSKTPSVTSVVINGQTLTAGTDYAVIANPATNAGQYVVVVNGMGDYKGTVTTAWEIAKAQATISGDDSITITGIDDPVTKTYTTDGDGAFSFAIAGNIATVANVGGEVTITPTALGSTTMTVTLSEGTNYLGATKTVPVEIVNPATVFGVVWNYSLFSPQLARLTPQTDPLSVVTTVPSQEPTACVGNDGNGQSDFDNYMPWAGMQRYNYVNGQVVEFVDYSNGETFVYIPEFWSKIVDDSTNNRMYFYISSAQMDKFVKHPGSGRYVGRYALNGNLLSTSGFMPKVNTSLAAFRAGITAIDNIHFQYDFHTYNAIELLYIVEFAHLNSEAKIGAGIISSSAVQTTGQTDILTYHTGRIIGTDNLSAIQYRWIENLWGNVWVWVDGILIQDGLFYICNDENKYASSITNDYESTGLYTPPATGWRKTDQDYNDCYLIPLATGSSGSTYTCDYYYYRDGLRSLLVGGSYSDDVNAGLFCWFGSVDPEFTNGANAGGRSILILGGDS